MPDAPLHLLGFFSESQALLKRLTVAILLPAAQLLRSWLNDSIGLSRPVVDFEGDMANGFLLGEVLCQHGLLPSMVGLVDRETPAAKVQNLTICQQPLIDLGVKFSSKIANELMTEAKGTAVNLCYQLKLGLENAKDGGGRPVQRRSNSQQVLLGSTLKPTRQLLSKHEAMQQQHFEALVKQQVQDPKQLAQALSLSRYTEHMIQQQQRDEELDQLRAEQYTAMVAQRRQLELSKLHEGSRLMREWQEEGYAKHAENIDRRKNDETSKLRFELSRRSKQAQRLAAASARAAGDLEKGVDEFESTLRRLQTDADGDGGDDDFGAEGAAALRVEVSASDHLRKLEKLDASSQAQMAGESKAYLQRLRTRRLEEEAARKEREMRRRKVMLEQDAAQAALEERRHEDLILTKLSRQCEEEKKIGEQLWVARKEKEVMRKNRELRDRQLAEAERLAQIDRRERDRESGLAAKEEYLARLAREKALAEEKEAARQAVVHSQHEATCRTIATELASLAARVLDFRSSTQPLLPQKVMRDWLTLFKAGVPLEPPGLDTPHVEELPEEGGEAEADATVNTAELDDYLDVVEDWGIAALSAVEMPADADGALIAPELLTAVPEEAGCAQTGRMVLDFLETCVPPPPKAVGAALPSSLVKMAVLGRPFAGKSLLAQRLAEANTLLVLMPQQLIEEALSALTTYEEAVAAATEGEEEGAEPSAAESVVAPATLALAQQAKAALPNGVPDEVLAGLLVEAIKSVDAVSYTGVVIDGFPRTLAQAHLLEKLLTGYEPPPKEPPKKGSKIAPPPDVPPEDAPPYVPGLDCVIKLDVPDEMARKRALGRRMDPETGEVYHLEFAPPPEEHEPGLNERLVSVGGAEDAEASLPAALVGYTDGEGALTEWFDGFGILSPIDAEQGMDEVTAAVGEAMAAKLADKEAKLAAKKAYDDEQAAAAAAAEEEAAAAEAAAAEAAAALAESGEAASAPAAAIAAAPAALATEASEAMYADWKVLEEAFLSEGSSALARERELQWRALQRVCSCRTEFYNLLTAPDDFEQLTVVAQERFNMMPTELRLSDGGKAELHMIAQDLQDALYNLSDTRRAAAEKAMSAMGEDGWLGAHALQLVLAVFALAQSEADRYAKTCQVVHSYCCLRSERALPYTPPPLAELPVPDAVECSVPVPSDAAAGDAAADPKAKGGKADPKAAKGAPAGGATAEATIIAALTALVASHCEPIEGAEAPPPAEEGATAEALRYAEAQQTLHSAITGEKAKLRRRLAAILRHGVGAISELKQQTTDMFSQLDGWLGDRQRSEASSGTSLVTILRRAVEDEVSLPHALQLHGDELIVDESLLMLPPPPPPPVPKPAQPPIEDRFTVIQLAGLATKLKAAASGLSLSADAAAGVFGRLGAAGFDAASPPLPAAWWPLGPPAYAKLTKLFCPADAPVLAWPEVVISLAPVAYPTEEELVANLLAAATLLGRTDLLPSAAEPEAEGAEPPPPVPPRAGLLLDKAQYDQLQLWFEAGATPQSDGYSVEGALKELLFELLVSDAGTLDLQQLLLYACDSSEKAFAVLGFASSKMLTLDGLYELLHREAAPAGLEKPEHIDAFSRSALRRLLVELKLGEAESAPCPLVSKHPAGAALLGACVSYVPKDAYGLVSELVNGAGTALKI